MRIVLFYILATKQMKERILRLIMDSFKDEFYNKAMSCIHALRKESIKVKKVSANLYSGYS